MEVVAAYACSHTGLMVTRVDRAPDAEREAIYGAFATLRDEIAALAPDAIVILATDHMRAHPLQHVPMFTIGVGPLAKGLGDAGIPPCEVPVAQRFAQAILDGCLERGIDLAFSEDVAIDHSFTTPLSLVTPDYGVPIVPLTQNCNVPPRPTFQRSHRLGAALREAIQAGPTGRVVLIGTGGLSHWVGSEERRRFMSQPAGTRLDGIAAHPVEIEDTGPINADFDRKFLDALAAGEAEPFIGEWPAERIEEVAGNGAQELRNWITIAGAVGDAPAEVLAYEAVDEWLTGMGVARFQVPTAA